MMKRCLTLVLSGLVCLTGLGGCTTMSGHSALISAPKPLHSSPVADAEQAVMRAPLAAEDRIRLGEVYFAAGRFASAEAAYADALALDPSLGRIQVKRALAQLAQGHDGDARASLDQARGHAPDADLGLAMAFAGKRAQAIALLEGAIRQSGGDVRVRQNLALAYGLAGRWSDAVTMAGRDVPADQIGDRVRRWASIVQRGPNAAEQLIAMLGVMPAEDPGQPAALALAMPAKVEPVLAAVEEPASPPIIQMPKAPVAMASIVPAVRKPARAAAATGFVVQLGAYHSAKRLETAWSRLSGQATYLSSRMPVASKLPNRISDGVLHRLAIGGFDSRADASRICARIKAKGGDCFVRAAAGDRILQWASDGDRTGNRRS
ncbi:MAG: hypothetical protein JWR77_32 [Rhizorhabdus sp.]|nr:hypothetical protein [Rhizorhabdus sp.]